MTVFTTSNIHRFHKNVNAINFVYAVSLVVRVRLS